MDTLKRLVSIQDRIASLQRDANKAQGALERLLLQLKEDFSCASVTQAEDLLEKLRKEEGVLRDRLEEAMNTFERKWGSLL